MEAARGAVHIPVVGAGSALYHVAYQLADRFGAIVRGTLLIPELLRRLTLMGCAARLTSMRTLDISYQEFTVRRQEVIDTFLDIARMQINEEGAQLIVEGGMGIFSNLGVGSREQIEKELGVPVLEGAGIAVKTAEMLVNLGLTHSKAAFPAPPT